MKVLVSAPYLVKADFKSSFAMQSAGMLIWKAMWVQIPHTKYTHLRNGDWIYMCNLLHNSLWAHYWLSSPSSGVVRWGAMWSSLRPRRKWIVPGWGVCSSGQRSDWTQLSSIHKAKTEILTGSSVSHVLFILLFIQLTQLITPEH